MGNTMDVGGQKIKISKLELFMIGYFLGLIFVTLFIFLTEIL